MSRSSWCCASLQAIRSLRIVREAWRTAGRSTTTSCYGCHGFNGETGARNLVGTNSPVLANAEVFTRFLRMRADQAPLLPSTRMPNYPESEVSDADARDLYAFIRSFRLNAPDVEDVPTLQQILESAERPYVP